MNTHLTPSILEDATENGPMFSADGMLAVIRTNPELAEGLYVSCMNAEQENADYRVTEPCREDNCPMCSAAALLAAPAPIDPKDA